MSELETEQQGTEEAEGSESAQEGPSPELLAEAKRLGWAPQEEWRGDPEKWVDAEAYVNRGREILPILRANNRSLNEQLTARDKELENLRKAHIELQESVAAMREIQTRETKGRLERQLNVARRNVEQARKEGDVDEVLRQQQTVDGLQEELQKIDAPPNPKDPKAKEPAAPDNTAVVEAVQTWAEQNPWYGTNKVKTALMHSIAQELRQDPANKGLVGAAFVEECARRTEELYEKEVGGKRQPVNKTSGGSHNAARGGGTVKGKSFADLPQDAQSACLADLDRVVGPNKVYKTKEEYQAYYVKEYFGE